MSEQGTSGASPAEETPRPPVVWEAPGSSEATLDHGAARPMSSGEIVERSVWVYRRGFLVLLAVAAVIQVPLAIVSALLGQRVIERNPVFEALARGEDVSPEALAQAFGTASSELAGAALVGVLIGIVATVLLAPALIETTSRLHGGRPATLGDAYRAALRSAPAVFLGSIAIGLAFLGLTIVFIVVVAVLVIVLSAAGQGDLGGLLAFLAVLAFIVAAIFVGLRWAVWTQAVVLEHRGPLEALRRSWGLVEGSMWRTLGLLILLGLASLVAGLVLGVIGGILGSPLPGAWSGGVTSILSVLTLSWAPILLTLLFLDLRARREPPWPPPPPFPTPTTLEAAPGL